MKMFFVFLVAFLVTSAISLWQVRKQKKEAGTSKRFSYLFLWQAFDNLVDLVFYPTAVGSLGAQNGFIFMFFFTLCLNAGYMFLNSKTEEDWTFMGPFNHLRDNDSQIWPISYVRSLRSSRFWKIRKFYIGYLGCLRKILRFKILGFSLSKPVGFLIFSIKLDSFCAITYLYHKNAKLSDPKVLFLYLLSHVICNAAWLPVALGISFGFSSLAEWIF